MEGKRPRQSWRHRPWPPPRLQALGRRLRSRLPVSPFPPVWQRRLRWIVPALALLAIAAGILFATLGAGEDGSGAAAGKNDSPDVSDDVARLKLPQRVDQLVIAGFDDVASEEFELRRGPTGGVLIGSQNWSNAKEGGELIKRLRSAAGSSPAAQPLFVAQQEGGAYRTLGDLPPAEAELQIGEGGSTRAARDWSLKAGRALREVGFDLNLFPIADVATLDSVVADRSFGDDAELDAAMTEAAIEGCADAGILCAPGRFPGMGAASADTADGPASVSLDAGSLESRDLLPFRAAFRAGAPAVVLSLALYAAYDPVTAAALSPAIATDLLRNQLGYEGAAITDDLSSGAVTAAQGAPEAAVAAIAAGADMVVVGAPGDARRVRAALLQAAREGGIPADRLDEAVSRVLALKRRPAG